MSRKAAAVHMMLWTRGQWHSHDTYDQPIRTKRRHRLCSCTVPCQGRFTCATCGRSKPWCVGSDDEVCDACWCATFDRMVHVPDAQPGARAS